MLLDPGTAADFLRRLGPLGDIIPIPLWPVQNVASLGDLFLTAGLAFFLFATLVRTPEDDPAGADRGADGSLQGSPGPAPARPGIDVDADGFADPARDGPHPALAATATPRAAA